MRVVPGGRRQSSFESPKQRQTESSREQTSHTELLVSHLVPRWVLSALERSLVAVVLGKDVTTSAYHWRRWRADTIQCDDDAAAEG